VLRFPHTKVVVVEKEPDIVAHQTSHNRWKASPSQVSCNYQSAPDCWQQCATGPLPCDSESLCKQEVQDTKDKQTMSNTHIHLLSINTDS
jgi:hypothetical protein